MATEQLTDPKDFDLDQFSEEQPLFYAVSQFDDCHDCLCDSGNLMLKFPGQDFTSSLNDMEEPTRDAFNELVDAIMEEHNLGSPEERISMVSRAKVYAEQERSRHFTAEPAPRDEEADFSDAIMAEVTKYSSAEAGYMSDKDIAEAMKADFAKNLEKDVSAFRAEETRLIKLNEAKKTERTTSSAKVISGLAGVAILGTAAFLARQISKIQSY